MSVRHIGTCQMQTRHIGLSFLVPTDQHTPEAMRPAVRARHHPPQCPDPGFLRQRFGFFPSARVKVVHPNLASIARPCSSSSPLSGHIP